MVNLLPGDFEEEEREDVDEADRDESGEREDYDDSDELRFIDDSEYNRDDDSSIDEASNIWEKNNKL